MGGRYQGVVGYVYFIYSPTTDRFRIGWSKRDPDGRFILTNMYSSEKLEKFALMRGTHADEQELHRRFDEHSIKGEWFRGHESIRQYIRENARPWQELLREELKKAMAGFDIPGPPDGKKFRSISRKIGQGQVASEPKKRGRPPKTPRVVVKPTHRSSRYGPLQALLDQIAVEKDTPP